MNKGGSEVTAADINKLLSIACYGAVPNVSVDNPSYQATKSTNNPIKSYISSRISAATHLRKMSSTKEYGFNCSIGKS